MSNVYDEKELIKKFSGKYIDVHQVYDYSEQKWKYEVRSVKNKLCENHNLPEGSIL